MCMPMSYPCPYPDSYLYLSLSLYVHTCIIISIYVETDTHICFGFDLLRLSKCFERAFCAVPGFVWANGVFRCTIYPLVI